MRWYRKIHLRGKSKVARREQFIAIRIVQDGVDEAATHQQEWVSGPHLVLDQDRVSPLHHARMHAPRICAPRFIHQIDKVGEATKGHPAHVGGVPRDHVLLSTALVLALEGFSPRRKVECRHIQAKIARIINHREFCQVREAIELRVPEDIVKGLIIDSRKLRHHGVRPLHVPCGRRHRVATLRVDRPMTGLTHQRGELDRAGERICLVADDLEDRVVIRAGAKAF
ncbi:hypothetical protein ACFQE0_20915 [Methylobacterium komagatae]|uniref:Uncharacterized protein n=1 Tax=Methylobacterium komagatae TaxID=374425 RepID=A0ABW2BP17_9HYPH